MHPTTPKELWDAQVDRAERLLGSRFGLRSECARAVGIEPQEMRRYLHREREPRAGVGLAIMRFLDGLEDSGEAKTAAKPTARTRPKKPESVKPKNPRKR